LVGLKALIYDQSKIKRENSHTTIIKPQDAKVNKQSLKQLKLHDEEHNHKYFIQLEILIGQANIQQ
jgi:hypothetical protein